MRPFSSKKVVIKTNVKHLKGHLFRKTKPKTNTKKTEKYRTMQTFF